MGRVQVRITTAGGNACGWPDKVNRRFVNETVQNGWSVSIGRLVAFSLLKYQDPGLAQLSTFSTLKTLHPGSLIPRYLFDSGGWLTCRQTDAEQLKGISELAAVGAALAYYKDATGCYANEIVRVQASGRRLDFRLMFPTDNTNLQVEAKGVFGKTTISKARTQFDAKIGVTGGLGGFLHVSRTNGLQSYLELRDPPGKRLICVSSIEARLRFYFGVLRSMYGDGHPQFEAFTRQYRLSLLSYLATGDWVDQPRQGFQVLASQTIGDRRYKGRLYDRRLLPEAIRAYPHWEHACEAFPAPYFFTGLDERVLLLVSEGPLHGLIDYADVERDAEHDAYRGYVSDAGIAHLEFRRPPAADLEQHSRTVFTNLRRQEERRAAAREVEGEVVDEQHDSADQWLSTETEELRQQLVYVFES